MITANITARADEPRHSHTWRTKEGAPRAAVDLGLSWLSFESPDEARAVAAECLKAADAMDALPPAEGGQE